MLTPFETKLMLKWCMVYFVCLFFTFLVVISVFFTFYNFGQILDHCEMPDVKSLYKVYKILITSNPKLF